MPNADFANGLSPLRYVSGAPYNGAVNPYSVPASDATPIYVGGLVKLAGDASAEGLATVTGNVANGNPVVGVVVSVAPVTYDSVPYRAASTARVVHVADDPNILFEAQVQGTLTTTMIGNVANLSTITAGNTTTGRSQAEVNLATVTATGDGTQDVLIIGLVKRIDNEFGADAKVYVRLNNHAFIDGSTGA